MSPSSGVPHAVAYSFSQVKKRSGEYQDFDIERIEQAIEKAFIETGEGKPEDARIVAHAVGDILEGEARADIEKDYVAEVEHIQNLVEKELMHQGFLETAKSYILYRFKQAEKREQKTQENKDKVERADISVVTRNGETQSFEFEKIKTFYALCAEEYPEVDVNEIMEAVKLNIYDGISTAEINQVLVMVTKARIERDPAYSKVAARVLVNELSKQIIGSYEFDEDYEGRYKMQFDDMLQKGIAHERYDTRMLELFDIEQIKEAIKPERDKIFEYMGAQIIWDRYLMKDLDQNFLELPQYFWMRIAMGLSLEEKEPTKRAIEFYETLSQMNYVASTPTLLHAGMPRAQMSSCYLNYVSDDLHHIFKVIGDNAQMSKWSGGIGTSWSAIRATNALIKSINTVSQGLIPFLKIVDSTTASINRSGKRRGAVAVYVEPWHLDYPHFLDLRKNTGDDRRRTHDINTVSWIPDLFMKRVRDGGEWTLFSPHDTPELHDLYGKAFEKKYEEYEAKAQSGEIELTQTMPAKDLWRKMITMLFETGHPWMTFKDACNVRSPQDHVGVIHSSNLCTEITLNTSKDETAVCNLGSISLHRHLTEEKDFDWQKIETTVETAMRMIDNVIDLNFYPTQEGENANLRHRPVGLGIMGYQNVLFEKRIPFDTDEAIAISDKLMEFVSYHAILNSSRLAAEKGKYSSYEGSKWSKGLLPIDTIDLLQEERGEEVDMDRCSTLDWGALRDHIKEHGMRNSNCMAIAPTATIGNITASLPSIEPIYKNLYVKSNFSGEFTVINTYLVNDLKERGLWNKQMLDKLKYYDGSVQSIAEVPEDLKVLYKEVFEIPAEWVIEHASRRQKWMDQSQSLNIFSRTLSGKYLSDLYFLAWKKGLKTTYYLRTLGASSIEKSTIDINQKFDAQNPQNENHKESTKDTQQSAETPGSQEPQVKNKAGLHVYTDMTCESCQ